VRLSAPDGQLAAALERLVRCEQSEKRLPSIAAAVVREGELIWEEALGIADVEHGIDSTTETQYRIGSITKTFTAVAIMQLRDAGKLTLDDSLDRYLDGVPHRPTIRSMLSHASGLQRETPGDVWVTLQFLSNDELLRDLGQAEQVLPPGARFHYSNLAFALLGQVVARVSGIPYEGYVEQRIIEPLGLSRTTFRATEPHAQGYLVDAYRDGVRREEPVETGSFIPSGQLWSTVRDLCSWASFLATPDEAVLAAKTLDEMRTVQVIEDHERWQSGYGLGLGLTRDGERILVGHGGAMPGFIARVVVSPKERTGAAVVSNSSTARLGALAAKLVATTVEHRPPDPEPWQVEDAPPAGIESALGRWWLEGDELVFSWRKGRLEARSPLDEEWEPPAVFEPEDGDLWRTVSGPEQGERLRLERDEQGAVARMFWATYLLTREPLPFGAAPR
jgi:CubicO group peptidase (beta-lactamase class C family)